MCEQKALHMRALKTFKDDFGIVRKNGEEWLIKMSDTETHIPNVYEEVSDSWLLFDVNRMTTRQVTESLNNVDDDSSHVSCDELSFSLAAVFCLFVTL